MNDKLNNNVTIIPPFKRFCMTIGELPSSYTESMTYYESLVWLCNYIGNTLIPAINNNGEAVTELQEKYVELKNYVDNYFENLDVQTEINNKLDDMAESGQLAEIIAQYLEISSVLGFDTKAALKGAENIVSGSICKTIGDLTYNDGKGNFYKIRDLVEGDVIDEDNLVALTNFPTLVAEKLPDYRMNQVETAITAIPSIESELEIIEDSVINVKLNGVVGDGIVDDTSAIQDIIDSNPGKTIYFPEGIYGITAPIVLYKANNKLVNLKLDNNATIKNISNADIECILSVGYDSTGVHNRFDFPLTSFIEGGTFDCSNVNYGIKVYPLLRLLEIRNGNFIKIASCGVLSDYDSSSNIQVGNLKINNCYFQGLSSNASNSTAIVIHSTDNEIRNITIDRTKVGVYTNGWGNQFINIHATAMFTGTPTTPERNATIGFECANTSSWNSFIDCYSDTYATGFKINGSKAYLTNCKTYWYYSDSNTIYSSVEVTNFNEEVTKLQLTNCNFNVPANGTNYHIKTATTGYTNNDNYSFVNCDFNYNTTLPYTDPAFCVQCNNKTAVNCDKQDYTPMANNQNVFYPIAVISGDTSVFDYDIQYVYNGYAKVYHNLASWISKTNIKTGLGFYLSVLNLDGLYYLCVSTDTENQHKNIVLSHISNNRPCKIFAREDMFRGISFSNVDSSAIKFRQKIFE